VSQRVIFVIGDVRTSASSSFLAYASSTVVMFLSCQESAFDFCKKANSDIQKPNLWDEKMSKIKTVYFTP
jgi:hypothetical protein